MQPRVPQKADDRLEDAGELQFINLTSAKIDPNAKKVVRKHVMSKFRRDQRKQNSAISSNRAPAKEAGIKPKASKANTKAVGSSSSSRPATIWINESPPSAFKSSDPCIRRLEHPRAAGTDTRDDDQKDVPENSAQLVSLPTILGAGRVDPLNSLPIQTSYQTAYLIDHFSQFINWRRRQLPNTLFANFFFTSLGDPALINAMMVYAANHDQFSTGKSQFEAIIHYHDEAARIVSSRISGTDPISDETIVATASLVIFEEMFGSNAAAQLHRHGLQEMVRLRGGIYNLGLQPVSLPFVGQAFISLASCQEWENAYAREPMDSTSYPTPPPSALSPPAIPTVVPKTKYLTTCECAVDHPPYPPSPDGWDEIMKETFTRIIDSSSLASSVLHTEHRLSIHNESYLVENRVNDLIKGLQTEDRNGKNVKVVYGQSWLLACRMYIYTVLRSNAMRPVRGDVLQGLLTELRRSLEEEFQGYSEIYSSLNNQGENQAITSTWHENYYSPNVLLWVLLVCGSNALSLASGTWNRTSNPTSKTHPYQQESPQISPVGRENPHRRTTIKHEDNEDFEWFSAATAHLSIGLGIQEWSVVKSRIADLPWVEWKIEAEYRGFWERAVFCGRVDVWTVFEPGSDVVLPPLTSNTIS